MSEPKTERWMIDAAEEIECLFLEYGKPITAEIEKGASIIASHAPQPTTSEPAHSVRDDFEHFLSYSGMRLSESPETIEKLFRAFFAAWTPTAPQSDSDKAARVIEAVRALVIKWTAEWVKGNKPYIHQGDCAEQLSDALDAALE